MTYAEYQNRVIEDPLTFEEYQKLSARTRANDLDDRTALTVAALGLAGEAGEVADLVKKFLGEGHELGVEKVREELGDLLWYVAFTAGVLGLSLSEIAQGNLEK